ncbi:MFS transporter [Sphingopyxis macrogoltabida]|jgi:MFS family permease|uniref:MFS transporter n=1 Tax=Sphingopyxis macrogoltabida TaxID=33050 RepID=A0A0N9UIC0_SPHMC|nr:MFS transporter [Sphingopyxis macrogoltabida]ALH83145.1 MFS transporter [Sphingopyxis macrogoltabida]
MLPFVRHNARWLAAGFLLSMFSSFGQTFFIGLSGAESQARFDLSGGEFGLLYMVATLASAATLPWIGKVMDVMRGRTVAAMVMPGLAAACLLAAWSPHIIGFVVALYLLRLLGQGMMTHIAQTETARAFVANRGRAMSLVVPGHQAGEAVLPALFVLVAAALGWQGAWTAAAALTLVIGMPLIIGLLAKPRVPQQAEINQAKAQGIRDWTRGEVIRDPVFYLLLLGLLAPPFIGTTIFFHQGHLIDVRGYDQLAFAGAFPVIAITTVGFGLVCGYLVDRLGSVRLLPFFLVPICIASLAAASITALWGIYLFMFLFGVSYGLTSNMFGVIWPEVYGTAHLGSIRALVVSGMVLATAVGPGLTGALIDQGITLPQQLWWMALWCVVATGALVLAARMIRSRTGQSD